MTSDGLHEVSELFYKIRREDGLYSCGGAWPRFTKKGKVWRTLGALVGHLHLVNRRKVASMYDDCEVIELQTIITDTRSVKSEIAAAKARKKTRKR